MSSWYREADKSTDSIYSSPKVVEQKLDAGGNYVSAPADGLSSPNGAAHAKPMGGSIIG